MKNLIWTNGNGDERTTWKRKQIGEEELLWKWNVPKNNHHNKNWLSVSLFKSSWDSHFNGIYYSNYLGKGIVSIVLYQEKKQKHLS